MGLLSEIETVIVDEAVSDDGWILAMLEELNQFQRNDVCDLVPKPQHKNIIGTKWVFRNKLNEQGEVVRNKARLVAQGYSQQEGTDYTETFALVASWKQSGYFYPMQQIMELYYIKWMLKVHFSME